MIAGPFFTPFMLSQLQLSYGAYMGLIGLSFASKAVFLPFIGRYLKRHGSRRVLLIGGITIVPLAVLWDVSDNLVYLAGLQVLAGFAWACYEMATFMLLFDLIPPKQRTRVLTLFNLASAAASAVGAVLGGAVLGVLGADHSAYLWVFALSTAARVLVIPLLLRVKPIQTHAPVTLPAVRVLSAGPPSQSMMRPVLASADDAFTREPSAAERAGLKGQGPS
jgi:MFS family permease